MTSPISCLLTESETLIVRLLESQYGSLATGELRALACALQSATARFSAERILLDLSEVRAIGAAFVGELASFRQQLAASGRELIIRHDPEGILALLGLGDIVECCDEECPDADLCAACA
jgi:anti-anti-sigma regulatory factor